MEHLGYQTGMVVLFEDAAIARFADVIKVIVKDAEGGLLLRHFVVMEAKKENVPRYIIGMFDPRTRNDIGKMASAEEFHVALDMRIQAVQMYIRNVKLIRETGLQPSGPVV